MSSVRGRGRNLEIAIDRPLPAATAELREQFGARPDFYRGSRAVANLGGLEPGPGEVVALREVLAEFGIVLDGVSGIDALAPQLADLGLAYLGPAPVAEVSALPRNRPPRQIQLSDAARWVAYSNRKNAPAAPKMPAAKMHWPRGYPRISIRSVLITR